MKKGDKLICHSNDKLQLPDKMNLTIGKIYEIIHVNGFYIGIMNDKHNSYYFSRNQNNNNLHYYKNWLCTEQEYRKMKIKKLNENR